MASNIHEVIAKFRAMTQCPVCLEQFKEPRALPCQHSFCTECLEGVLGTGQRIECPYCKKETRLPNGVRELPVDFRANSWLEILAECERPMQASEAVEEDATAGAAAHGTEAAIPLDCCSVCEEIPTVSKNLGCGHTLCMNCAQYLLPVGGDTLYCPTCLQQTRIVTTATTGSHTPSAQSQGGRTFEGMERSRLVRLLESLTRAFTAQGLQIRSQAESAIAMTRLTFHPSCGSNIIIHDNQITAHRENPLCCLDHGLVLTSRHLKPDELFEVILDEKVDEVGLTISIGVTTTSPIVAAVAADLYGLGTGTWALDADKAWHKEGYRWPTLKEYEQNLSDLKVGDRVGVMRTEIGDLHFYINGADLGVAAHNVPLDVYGVVGIEADVQQVTIIQSSVP